MTIDEALAALGVAGKALKQAKKKKEKAELDFGTAMTELGRADAAHKAAIDVYLAAVASADPALVEIVK